MTNEKIEEMQCERERKHLQCGEKILKFNKSVIISAFILLFLLTIAAGIYCFCYKSENISFFHIIIHYIIVLIIFVICITCISYVAITYFIFKKRSTTQEENTHVANEMFDRVFNQNSTCKYKCEITRQNSPTQNHYFKEETKTIIKD